jgi:hypothetical protein
MSKVISLLLFLLMLSLILAGCLDDPLTPETNSDPDAMIITPVEGQSYLEGDSVHFAGSGMDEEDGELEGSSLNWVSDKDGDLGAGESFSRTDLSVNTHVITLTALDSDGAADTASVTIYITEVPPIKVLFIGSSHFATNEQHLMFQELARSGGREIIVDAYTVGGAYLEFHASNQETLDKINSQQWDFVLLQGSGAITAFPYTHQYIFPSMAWHGLKGPLDTLKQQIEANCADTKTVYMMPWAYEDGCTWIEGRTETYFDMQQLIYDNTLEFSDEVGFVISPVGWAWNQVMKTAPGLHYLFNPDWNHPSVRGSYLAACVFYSILFLEETHRFSYHAGIPADEAEYFQFIASMIVMRNLGLWNR